MLFTILPSEAEMVRPLTPDSKKRCEVELYRLKKEKERKERQSKVAIPAGKNDTFVDAQRYIFIIF